MFSTCLCVCLCLLFIQFFPAGTTICHISTLSSSPGVKRGGTLFFHSLVLTDIRRSSIFDCIKHDWRARDVERHFDWLPSVTWRLAFSPQQLLDRLSESKARHDVHKSAPILSYRRGTGVKVFGRLNILFSLLPRACSIFSNSKRNFSSMS